MESLTPHKDDLLVIDNMDFCTGNNHEGGMAAMLTASGNTSIDQMVADHIGGDSRFVHRSRSAHRPASGVAPVRRG